MTRRRPSYFREKLSGEDLKEAWALLADADRLEGFKAIDRTEAEEYFLGLNAQDQAEIILGLSERERRLLMRLLAPDDAADVIQRAHADQREFLLNLLDDSTHREVVALLAYAEDEAGGLMNPRYIRLRPDISVDEAISYLRKQTQEHTKATYYAYVLDSEQHLVGVISFRELLSSQPEKKVQEVMKTELVTASEKMDQEEVSRLFAHHDLMAIPVVDDAGHMKGIVTVDDIIDVVREEATEDIQKIGGSEALDEPYLKIRFLKMIRKRASWLVLLFFGEMLTATAMGFYENSIAKAVVLALFIPLIISSGGNSGSQASTLVIRAMALGEIQLRDWWKILFREISTGLVLGGILGTIGLTRILLWPWKTKVYGEHFVFVGLTVALSLIGVVLWGTIAGATLPLLLKRLGFDPAAASAPLVATLVDVTGLVIYFTTASLFLGHIIL